MKNLFHRSSERENFWVYQEMPEHDFETNDVTTEKNEENELTSEEVDQVVDGVVDQLGDLGEGKANLVRGVIESKMAALDLPIADFLEQLEGALENALEQDADDRGLDHDFTVDLGVTETETVIENTTVTGAPIPEPGTVEYKDLFRDPVYDFMEANPEFYFDGEGNVRVNEETKTLEEAGFPMEEGQEVADWSGKERVKRDLQNLNVSSGEELWEMIQWGLQNPEKGTGITGQNFTKEDASKLFQYKQHGFLEGNSGEYALDGVNDSGEKFSTEVMESQELIAKANAALEAIQMGNSMEPNGADGQDGYATVNARRHFAVEFNRLRQERSQTKTEVVRTRNIDVGAKAIAIPELVSPGKKLVLEDVSRSMEGDIKFTHAHLEQALLQNPPGVEIKIGQIDMETSAGVQDQEAGFYTAARMIPNNFDPNAQGNEVIIYTDERQQDTGLEELVDVAAEYNVKLTIYYFHPGRKVEGDNIRDDFQANAGKFKKVSFDLSKDDPESKKLVKDQLADYTKAKYSNINKKKKIREQTFYDDISSKESQINTNFEMSKEFEEMFDSFQILKGELGEPNPRIGYTINPIGVILDYFDKIGSNPNILLHPLLPQIQSAQIRLQNSRYYEQEEREIMDRFENMMGVSFDMNQMAYVPRTEDIDVSVADTEVKK